MKRWLALFLCIILALSGCAPRQADREDEKLHILATTYPLYLFTRTLTQGAHGVEVTQLIDETVSCLHDYTLTVPDMKAIERADAVILNGAGFEEFMEDALSHTDAVSIDCSVGVHLLPAAGHEHHHHDGDQHHGHYDPHYWLSAEAGQIILNNILQGLLQIDPTNAEVYNQNYSAAIALFPEDATDLSSLPYPYLITFHDGFHYLAHDAGLTLLRAIEEEEGSTASAADIKEITALIQEYNIPAIFTEENGSDRTARVIARETGVEIHALDMLMTGDGQDITAYFEALNANYAIIREALS